MSRFLDNLLLFGRILRRAGVAVDPERLHDVEQPLGVDGDARAAQDAAEEQQVVEQA